MKVNTNSAVMTPAHPHNCQMQLMAVLETQPDLVFDQLPDPIDKLHEHRPKARYPTKLIA